jgi:hypothetical protein
MKIRFTEEEFNKLKVWLIPEAMEDKWFIFYEKNYLYFHRSWTWYWMYKAEILKEKSWYTIKEFFAEENENIYKNTDDYYDVETFIFLIFWWLLHYNIQEIYAKNIIKNEEDSIKAWSTFWRMFFK